MQKIENDAINKIHPLEFDLNIALSNRDFAEIFPSVVCQRVQKLGVKKCRTAENSSEKYHPCRIEEAKEDKI